MAFFGAFGPVFTENARIGWAEVKAVVRRRERRAECMSWTAGVDYLRTFQGPLRGSTKRATFPGRNIRRPVLFDYWQCCSPCAIICFLRENDSFSRLRVIVYI